MTEEDVRPAVSTAEEAVALAEEAIAGRLRPREGSVPTAVRAGDRWIVEWAVPHAGGAVRGPDFEARVTLDAWTGRALEVLAGS